MAYPHGSARHHARPTGPLWLCRERVQAHLGDQANDTAYAPDAYDAAILGLVRASPYEVQA